MCNSPKIPSNATRPNLYTPSTPDTFCYCLVRSRREEQENRSLSSSRGRPGPRLKDVYNGPFGMESMKRRLWMSVRVAKPNGATGFAAVESYSSRRHSAEG